MSPDDTVGRPAGLRSNRSMPASAVIPVLTYPDVAEAAAWLCEAFDFAVRWRIADHRIQLAAGDGHLVVAHGRRCRTDVR